MGMKEAVTTLDDFSECQLMPGFSLLLYVVVIMSSPSLVYAVACEHILAQDAFSYRLGHQIC